MNNDRLCLVAIDTIMSILESSELGKWQNWIETIQDEVQAALDYQEIYWDFKHNIREKHSEPEVRNNNIFYDMLAWGYAYKVFLTIRKLTAISTTEITLLRLLKEIGQSYRSADLQADIDYLSTEKKLKLCRQYVNKYLAHASEDLPKDTTFSDAIETINAIWKLVGKYYLILKGNNLHRSPLGYDWKQIFNYKWIES
jgi:hypothetical protein